jgi:MFS family permease
MGRSRLSPKHHKLPTGKISMFPPARRPLAIAFLVAGAFFMENLDGTVIATAMPQMARSFGASPVDLNIGMTAYLLALAVFIPMSGWLADRFGAKPVFAIAIGIHRRADSSGTRRGHDGAGGAARGAAHYG